jgi:gluconolactonase
MIRLVFDRMSEGTMTKILAAAVFVAAGVCTLAAQSPATTAVIKLDPALDDILATDAKPELLKGDYFGFVEGPVWVQERGGGYLLFSDVAANNIYKWTPDGKVSVFLERSGYTGTDTANVGGQSFNGRLHLIVFGSNGITLDPQGRVVFATHGNRTIERLEKDGTRTVLADRYEGKRLNSPNDLVIKSNGSVYFTDPPGGLRGGVRSPAKELPYSGVFLLKDGKLQALVQDPDAFPNGIAFSPDERYLYVNGARKIMRYEVKADDTIANGQLLVDMTADPAPGGTDGMKVDQKGNIYCTGAGGVWIISPAGKHLGTIRLPEQPANLAFGDADSRSIYFTARQSLYRIRVKIPGIRP